MNQNRVIGQSGDHNRVEIVYAPLLFPMLEHASPEKDNDRESVRDTQFELSRGSFIRPCIEAKFAKLEQVDRMCAGIRFRP